MTERQTYKALKLIQKRNMKLDKHRLICQHLADVGYTAKTEGKHAYELTIKGKILIWDYENWKLTS